MRICWVITGAGHFLSETVDFLASLREAARPTDLCADIFLTRAGVEVSAMYRQTPRLEACGFSVRREDDFSSSDTIYFAGGRYRALVIAPATANTVAKCALGIADSLASNFFAQAGKSGVPVFILPTDAGEHIKSVTPSGNTIDVRPRPVELERLAELSRFPNVTALRSPDELGEILSKC